MKNIARSLLTLTLLLGACGEIDPPVPTDEAESALFPPPSVVGCWRNIHFQEHQFWNDGLYLQRFPPSRLVQGTWHQQGAATLIEITDGTYQQTVSALTTQQMTLNPGGIFSRITCGSRPTLLSGGQFSTMVPIQFGQQLHNTYNFSTDHTFSQHVVTRNSSGNIISDVTYTGTWSADYTYLTIFLETDLTPRVYPYVLLVDGSFWLNGTAYWPGP